MVGDLSMDEDAREVRRADELIDLTATEFELLCFLMRNPRRVLSKAQILDRVWNYDFGGQAHVVKELYISYLRKKIDAGREPLIHTVRGVGYVLKPASPKVHSPWARCAGGWPRARCASRLVAGLLALLRGGLRRRRAWSPTWCSATYTLINQLDLRSSSSCGQRPVRVLHGSAGGPRPAAAGRTTAHELQQDPGSGPENATFGARVKHGQVTNQGIIDGSPHLSAADQAKLVALPPDGEFYTLDLNSIGGDYRVTTAVPGRDHDVLITGLPLAEMEATLRRVEIAEVAAFSAALVLTGLLGTGGLSGLSLVPLRRVAATATRVTQLPLASGEVTLPDRVPDANPRTEVGQVAVAFNRMLGHVESALARAGPPPRPGCAASPPTPRQPHELRTPLAAIRGYAETRAAPPRPGPGRHRARAAARSRPKILADERAGRRAAAAHAQLDSRRSPLAQEPVDLSRLAIDATSDARAAAPTHRWLLELPDEPVQGPRRRTPPAPGPGQPDEQRRQKHTPTRHHRHRRPDHHRAGPGRTHASSSPSPTAAPASPRNCSPPCSNGSSAATPPAPTTTASPPPPASAWPSSTPSPPPTAAPSTSTPKARHHPLHHHPPPARPPGNWPRTSVHSGGRDRPQTRSSRAGRTSEGVLTPRSTFPRASRPQQTGPQRPPAGPALAFGKGAVSAWLEGTVSDEQHRHRRAPCSRTAGPAVPWPAGQAAARPGARSVVGPARPARPAGGDPRSCTPPELSRNGWANDFYSAAVQRSARPAGRRSSSARSTVRASSRWTRDSPPRCG